MPSKITTAGDAGKALRKGNFAHVLQIDVPHGRRGKHKEIVTDILRDLSTLTPGGAIRIPLKELPASKEKIRSALSRACQQNGLKIVTSADAEHLYVWPAAKPLFTKRKLIG
jgi:hypothetical protein